MDTDILLRSIDQLGHAVRSALGRNEGASSAELDSVIAQLTDEVNATIEALDVAGDTPVGEDPFDHYTTMINDLTQRLDHLSPAEINGLQAALAARQPIDSTLTGLAEVDFAADTLPYATGADSFTSTPLSTFARELLAQLSDEGIRAKLGLGTAALRTAQTMLLDRTEGALMTVGAFGIGGHLDLRKTIFETGTPANVFSKGTVTGIANGASTGMEIPGLIGIAYGTLTVNGQWADVTAGAAINRVFTMGSRMWGQQALSANAWGPWVEFFSRNNIVGAVTHANGAPTGAVIESGTNANGYYTRYADGTQVCTTTITGPLSMINYSTELYRGEIAWRFPAEFSTPPTALAGSGVDSNTTGWVGGGTNVYNSSCLLSYFSITSNVINTAIRLIAHGRWY